ncbi:MAG: homoserine dehydrogenase [Deltaproteobacteria bacterium]|nr:homoserine dehydrogenase [Deltaproteobacteria bacterium]MBW2132945.1 homoserine dehydrogenase [Deltaproteobacteria bacterium]
MKRVCVGLVGCGTVGTGVARILLENASLLKARVGTEIHLKRVADIDFNRDRGIRFKKGVFVEDAFEVVDDPEIAIVIEMIGGQGVAKDLILRAIRNGKHVVTANKALLAAQGNALFAAAFKNGVDLAFEASVGGCMPVIKTLRESLVANRIQSMIGILNGTCNYILTRITREGIPFPEALAQAQAQGYAEADPTLDVEGHDTAHKLAILSALAYGMKINLKDIYVEGISGITPLDIAFARQFGYTVKLLAIGKNLGDRVEARIHPTMIPETNLLSSVSGAVNALMLTGDRVGDLMLYGYGAGMMPTASAVVADVVDLARNLLSGSRPLRVPGLSYQKNRIKALPVVPIGDIHTYYYFRFSALDQPGVLSKIAGVLGKHGISIQSVHQKGRKTNGSVPVVMLTHLAREKDVAAALSEIGAMEVVDAAPVLIRIEEEVPQS